jgi:hypothetical protein
MYRKFDVTRIFYLHSIFLRSKHSYSPCRERKVQTLERVDSSVGGIGKLTNHLLVDVRPWRACPPGMCRVPDGAEYRSTDDTRTSTVLALMEYYCRAVMCMWCASSNSSFGWFRIRCRGTEYHCTVHGTSTYPRHDESTMPVCCDPLVITTLIPTRQREHCWVCRG